MTVLVTPPIRILRLVPSNQMSPSLGEVGAVPERRRRDADAVVAPNTSSNADGVELPDPTPTRLFEVSTVRTLA